MSQPKTTSGKWKNLWREIYEEEFGKEETKKRLKTQFEVPPVGFFSGLGLSSSVLFLETALRFSSWKTGKRGTHPVGVGGCGFAYVLENPKIPEMEFFTQGRAFRVRMRHACLRIEDDAGMDGRACSIKFTDEQTGGPFDLVMNTGYINLFINLPSFVDIAGKTKDADAKTCKMLHYAKPYIMEATGELLRRAPTSYTLLKYYSQTTFIMKVKSGSERLVRFRIVPADVEGRTEDALPDEQDQREPWVLTRRPDEKRPVNYLRDHYKSEIEKRALKYSVQIQFHDAEYPNDDLELFNPCVGWNNERCPWQNWIEVVLTTALSDNDLEKTEMDLNKRPDFLTYPAPKSKYDYNSIPYGREKIYPVVQKARKNGNPIPEEEVEYKIEMKGVDSGLKKKCAALSLTIFGTKFRTEPLLLGDQTTFNKTCETTNSVLTFTLSTIDVGRVLAVEITKQQGQQLNLNCVKITTASGETVNISCGKQLEQREIFPIKGSETSQHPFLQQLTRYNKASK